MNPDCTGVGQLWANLEEA